MSLWRCLAATRIDETGSAICTVQKENPMTTFKLSEESQKVEKSVVDNRPNICVSDQRSSAQMLADGMASVNRVLVPDPDGKITQKFPTYRDPEPPHKMIWIETSFKEVLVPPTHVLRYTHSVVIDMKASHSDFVVISSQRLGFVFDRTYTYADKIYHRCAYIPDEIQRAGVLYTIKIDKNTRRPKAVLKRIKGTQDPMYEIIGHKEEDYRALRRVFERYWITKKQEQDDELNNFKFDSMSAIPEELAV